MFKLHSSVAVVQYWITLCKIVFYLHWFVS